MLFLTCSPGRESITDAGDPLDVLDNFYELIGAFWYQNGFGEPLDEGTVLSAKSMVRKANRRQQGGQGEATYYMYEMKPHTFISATVSDGQLYVMNASSTARQWSAAAAKRALRAKPLGSSHVCCTAASLGTMALRPTAGAATMQACDFAVRAAGRVGAPRPG